MEKIACLNHLKNMWVYEATNIHEYLDIIGKIHDDDRKKRSGASVPVTWFYRGQANSDWKLSPRICREARYYWREQEMYHEFLRISPHGFSDVNTELERLIRMQHYGLPTRLLDLTTNPLVASFFSCEEEREDSLYSKVFAFSVPTHKLFRIQDHGGKIFSDHNIFHGFSIQNMHEQLNEYYENAIQKGKNLPFFQKIQSSKDEKENPDFLKEYMKTVSFLKDWKVFEERLYFKKASPDKNFIARREKILDEFKHLVPKNFSSLTPSFESQNRVIINDYMNKLINLIAGPIFFLPTLDNNRIKQQQGAFLIPSPTLFGCCDAMQVNKAFENENMANLFEDILKESCTRKLLPDGCFLDPHCDVGIYHISINNECREKFCGDLAHIGIQYGTIYAELPDQAKYIQKEIGHIKFLEESVRQAEATIKK